MKKRTAVILILVLAMLLSIVACKKTAETPATPKVQLDTSDGYDYSSLNCNGEDFVFLQCDEDRWGMKTALAPDGFVNELVSDEVYRRNLFIEELYNVNIRCINQDIYETGEYVRNQNYTGIKTVDVAYVIGSSVSTLISEGLLNDFSEMPHIQIYEPWWNQMIREESQFGGSSALYYTQSDISLTAFELTWCVVANEDMISELNLEDPYSLVKEDQWTMTKLFELMRQGMKPNSSDGSYDYNEDTDCIVGFTSYDNFTIAALNGCECFITGKDEIGNPKFTGEGERFQEIVEKWATAFHTPGFAVEANEEGFHYEKIFAASRALFAGIEIKATSLFKKMNMNYMILPLPKYNADQKSYYSNVNFHAPALVIPRVNQENDKTGRILDTMAYKSYKDLLPVYYDQNLSLRAMANPESKEMLDIIRDTRCFETSLIYGWTTDFYYDVKNVFAGSTASTSIASTISKYRPIIIQSINDYLSGLQ